MEVPEGENREHPGSLWAQDASCGPVLLKEIRSNKSMLGLCRLLDEYSFAFPVKLFNIGSDYNIQGLIAGMNMETYAELYMFLRVCAIISSPPKREIATVPPGLNKLCMHIKEPAVLKGLAYHYILANFMSIINFTFFAAKERLEDVPAPFPFALRSPLITQSHIIKKYYKQLILESVKIRTTGDINEWLTAAMHESEEALVAINSAGCYTLHAPSRVALSLSDWAAVPMNDLTDVSTANYFKAVHGHTLFFRTCFWLGNIVSLGKLHLKTRKSQEALWSALHTTLVMLISVYGPPVASQVYLACAIMANLQKYICPTQTFFLDASFRETKNIKGCMDTLESSMPRTYKDFLPAVKCADPLLQARPALLVRACLHGVYKATAQYMLGAPSSFWGSLMPILNAKPMPYNSREVRTAIQTVLVHYSGDSEYYWVRRVLQMHGMLELELSRRLALFERETGVHGFVEFNKLDIIIRVLRPSDRSFPVPMTRHIGRAPDAQNAADRP